jgi:flagella basal body P-ring formation protein FlgA
MITRVNCSTGILVVVALAIRLSATQVSAAEIRFHPQAKCGGQIVRLGDVAEIITPDKEAREALQQIELGPAATTRQVLRSRDVQDRLAAQGIKLVDHEFSGSAAVTLLPDAAVRERSESLPLSKSGVNAARKAVVEAIRAHLKKVADPEEAWQVELNLDITQVRAASANYRGVSATGGKAPWTGSQRFTVMVPGEHRAGSFTVVADVQRAARVVVAINPIARGERIRAEDVELQPMKQGSPQRQMFPSLDDVLDQEAARNIAVGQPIDQDSVRPPILVKRGEVVELFSRAGAVQVRTKARALEAGGEGDNIKVALLSDRRPLVARVCGVQEVEILGAAPSVED